MPSLHQDPYLATYLDQADLPEMHRVQDSRLSGPDKGDAPFAVHGGQFSGLQVWMGADDAVVWRLVDIRFAFPDPACAAAYHRERLRVNAEGHPGVRGAPFVGRGCTVFGGVQAIPVHPDLTMTSYFYLFRVSSVLVKLFAAQSAALAPGTLCPLRLTPLARRIEARIGVALEIRD
jgi:hypothetical protein